MEEGGGEKSKDLCEPALRIAVRLLCRTRRRFLTWEVFVQPGGDQPEDSLAAASPSAYRQKRPPSLSNTPRLPQAQVWETAPPTRACVTRG